MIDFGIKYAGLFVRTSRIMGEVLRGENISEDDSGALNRCKSYFESVIKEVEEGSTLKNILPCVNNSELETERIREVVDAIDRISSGDYVGEDTFSRSRRYLCRLSGRARAVHEHAHARYVEYTE